jgi:uncharacterized protein (DUF1330 family)
MAMPHAYVIVEMKVSDPERYKNYMAAAPAVVKAHGGEFIVRGGALEVLEGDWKPVRMAVLRFPSLQAAKAFYDDPMYQEARALREGATDYFNMVAVEGYQPA